MTGSDLSQPTIPLSEKLSSVTHHHLLTRVLVKLDLDNWNFGSWEFFFVQLCSTYGVETYIRSPSTGTSTTLPPLTPEELKVDKIVLSWILFTLSDSLQARLVVARPQSAKEAWGLISEIVKDNKRSRTNALKAELRSIKLGDQSMESYFQKIDSIVNILTSLDASVNDEDVVHYALEGLPDTYNQVCGYMHWKDTFPDLKSVRSLLITEEMRLKSRALALPVDSSSPMVLMAERGNHRRPFTPQIKSWRPCYHFVKGSCRFGDNCKFSHDTNAKSSDSSDSKVSGTKTDELLEKLLAKLSLDTSLHAPGLNSKIHKPTVATTQHLPSAYQVSSPTYYTPPAPTYPIYPAQHPASPIVPPGFYYPPLYSAHSTTQPTPAQQVPTAPPVQQHNSLAQSASPSGQPTVLPHAFTAGTLHDPTTGVWNMDTGVSSHLNNSVTCLSTSFNSCMYPFVSVGDGHSIPVTNTGHSILPTSFKSLNLNNVLITPHIVKNLISVRQFVRDNNCTVEFDAFGFSVKDFMTRRVLLRCDSTGDLYPVTAPSQIPQAFLVSPNTWHQRLGHPGSDVLRRLVSHNFISCNKEKPPALCHACQLGKHVRLPFVSSNTLVTSSFDIIHSDVWTSPIPSLSGYKYYVLFLDHYSQFVWVYPLLNKSDVYSKILLFRTYVHTQFKSEIKSFQCDHGGEFDNRNLHRLFSDNGIEFRFSCPKTSQQNGKSERMVRTINNLIRTLLFQANLPPTFWVEALNMAVHLLNILPSTAINNDTPYTRLFEKNPDYSLLCTFGCLCYPHLYPNHKLEPRAAPSIFLGHASNHRGYRCLELSTKKIIISRHVTFDETVFPYSSHQTTTTPTTYSFLDDTYDLPSIIPQPTVTQPTSTPIPNEPMTPLAQTPNTPTPSDVVQMQSPTHGTNTPATAPIPSSNPEPTTHNSPTPTPIDSSHSTTQNLHLNHTDSLPNSNPVSNPNSVSIHPMVTRFRDRTTRPTQRLNLHVSTISPLPKSYRDAFNDPNWQNAMYDEYSALINNNTWTLVPRPMDTNIVRCMWLP
ncbi:ribonuclease H-like domain-containing protein [Tanacetum coccineum]|uniref:Ribonuclease H-like domain-containing protein n=1 Tax=Tanacetum coccineum TaxID=301880 RepID=A0ABQ4ZB25_9ASTR